VVVRVYQMAAAAAAAAHLLLLELAQSWQSLAVVVVVEVGILRLE
jgi:hypothetical protein